MMIHDSGLLFWATL